jgi:type IV secretory pathway VirJ component
VFASRGGRLVALAAAISLACGWTSSLRADARASIGLRGHTQTLFVSGPASGSPVIVSSGDGGWIHLAPHVASALAAHGYYVVGFDSKAYLESFTSGRSSLSADDVPADYRTLATWAASNSHRRPILIGVSEGAGLSVLAATDALTRASIAGVVAIGLPTANELAWRWKDDVIYLTHGVPSEPTFLTASVIDRVSPAPLAAIHSSHDEYTPTAEARRLIDLAHDPRRLWVVSAADHRFSDNLAELDARVLEAADWVAANTSR